MVNYVSSCKLLILRNHIYIFVNSDFFFFRITEILSITQDILSALSYLHGEGITHRNMSPNNILFTNDVSDSVFFYTLI